MNTMNPSVNFYFSKSDWQSEINQLRKIALGCGLTEELKWGCPCYTFQQKNIVLIHVFKEYCALLFFKGALLQDPKQLLIQQTKNVQAARQLRFTDTTTITRQAKYITAYIFEAIELEKAGLKVPLKKTTAFAMPKEFKEKLAKHAALAKAFKALTPGRQRAYLLHFAQPVQSKTKIARIEKNIPRILNGQGLNDL